MSEPFDFEAFISGAQLARRTVSLYRVDHKDEIAELQAQHDRLPDVAGDEREGAPSARAEIAQRIADLRSQMEASATRFVIRTLTPDEFRAEQESSDPTPYRQLATQSVDPKLDADQWRRIGEAIGASQFGRLVQEANDLVLSKVAVPDFSQSVSTTLNPRPSSQS